MVLCGQKIHNQIMMMARQAVKQVKHRYPKDTETVWRVSRTATWARFDRSALAIGLQRNNIYNMYLLYVVIGQASRASGSWRGVLSRGA